jgi:hypothetical protein
MKIIPDRAVGMMELLYLFHLLKDFDLDIPILDVS